MRKPWTDVVVQTLDELVQGRDHSASMIADELRRRHGVDVSRNAVIGKITRLWGPAALNPKEAVMFAQARLGHQPKQPRAVTPTPPRRPAPLPQPLPPPTDDYDDPPVTRLREFHCRWIDGDTGAPGYGFCGSNKRPGSSYCDHHHQVCYVPPRPARRRGRPVTIRRN